MRRQVIIEAARLVLLAWVLFAILGAIYHAVTSDEYRPPFPPVRGSIFP